MHPLKAWQNAQKSFKKRFSGKSKQARSDDDAVPWRSMGLIAIVPVLVCSAYTLMPYQPPIRGIQNNWGWLIAAAINAAAAIWIYMFWERVYFTKAFYSTIIITVAIAMSILFVIAQYFIPLKATCIFFVLMLAIAYPPVLLIRARIARISTLPGFKVAMRQFSILRLVYASITLISWAYIILFFAFPSLQLLFSICYSFIMFLMKYGLVIHTQRTTSNEYHGLPAFWVEYFHTLFVSLCFAGIRDWYVAAAFLIAQMASPISTLIMLTKQGYQLSALMTRRGGSDTLGSSIKSASPNLDTPPSPSSNVTIAVSSSSFALTEPQSFSSPPSSPPFSSSTAFVDDDDALRNHRLLVCRTGSLSVLAHIIAPFHYVPIVLFLRYGWNREYFYYASLTQEAFVTSLIINAVSFGVALLNSAMLVVAVRKMGLTAPPHNLPSLTSVLLRDIAQYRDFIMAAMLCGLSAATGSLLYHNQIYYAFVVWHKV